MAYTYEIWFNGQKYDEIWHNGKEYVEAWQLINGEKTLIWKKKEAEPTFNYDYFLIKNKVIILIDSTTSTMKWIGDTSQVLIVGFNFEHNYFIIRNSNYEYTMFDIDNNVLGSVENFPSGVGNLVQCNNSENIYSTTYSYACSVSRIDKDSYRIDYYNYDSITPEGAKNASFLRNIACEWTLSNNPRYYIKRATNVEDNKVHLYGLDLAGNCNDLGLASGNPLQYSGWKVLNNGTFILIREPKIYVMYSKWDIVKTFDFPSNSKILYFDGGVYYIISKISNSDYRIRTTGDFSSYSEVCQLPNSFQMEVDGEMQTFYDYGSMLYDAYDGYRYNLYEKSTCSIKAGYWGVFATASTGSYALIFDNIFGDITTNCKYCKDITNA